MSTLLMDALTAQIIETAVNSLWQGSVLVGLVAGLLRIFPRTSAARRHAVWSVVLLGVATLTLLPVARQVVGWAGGQVAALSGAGRSVDEPGSVLPKGPRAAVRPPVSSDATPSLLPPLVLSSSWWSFSLAALLVLGSGMHLARVAVGVVRLRGLAARCRPLGEAFERRLPTWWAVRLGGRRARLCRSEAVSVPLLIGLGRPTIALPDALLSSLSLAELDAVSLHELGHARRWDDWTKLAQRTASALLFFHPAVRWMGRQLDADREMACDAWVVATMGERRTYASSLVHLAELTRAGRVPSLAPYALTRTAQLSSRIEALFESRRAWRPGLSRLVLAALAVVLAAASWVTPALTIEAPPPSTTDDSLRAETASAIGRDETDHESIEVRRVALEALGDRAGTVVVMDPFSGRVHTIVNQDWGVRRVFAPASTIKLVTALAALRGDTLDPAFEEALARSTTDYFQVVGERVGHDRFVASARDLGLAEPTGIDLDGEVAGVVANKGIPSLTYGSGVGVEVTPVQLATLVSAIANGGTVLVPQRSRGAVEGHVRRRLDIPQEARTRLVRGMVAAVEHGTGAAARGRSWSVAGKTGTWQDGAVSTGLFAAFAPAAHPRFAVVVVTMGTDERGSTAARIAGDVFEGLVSLQEAG